MMYQGPSFCGAGLSAALLAFFLAWALALPFNRRPTTVCSLVTLTGVLGRRWVGYPPSLAVEASHDGIELVSFLYSRYTLTKVGGNILVKGDKRTCVLDI